ncbi:hypothetical protein [Pseudonocardia asaccharolytica]|uniref:Uncharacterized protein n=1 Tax=Pseudonocardia asaccharolytica DSM 44247 = NBRC 16224 TaxID=1123024 RepID=A0A511D3E9_9PSEU|nr:hypothetical protein [Pseudonocardia asaccharolytica]GEL19316.1 hypothetical protein PA7_31530 [Pseudonocardia asaccharolytica DSM 44247 = NBRC 16224]
MHRRAHYPDRLVPLVDDTAFWVGALLGVATLGAVGLFLTGLFILGGLL